MSPSKKKRKKNTKCNIFTNGTPPPNESKNAEQMARDLSAMRAQTKLKHQIVKWKYVQK